MNVINLRLIYYNALPAVCETEGTTSGGVTVFTFDRWRFTAAPWLRKEGEKAGDAK